MFLWHTAWQQLRQATGMRCTVHLPRFPRLKSAFRRPNRPNGAWRSGGLDGLGKLRFCGSKGLVPSNIDLRNHISNIIGRRKCHFRWDQWWMDGIWGFSVGLHCSLSRWPKLPVILWIIPRRTITLQPRAGIAFADVMFSSPPMPAALWKHAVRPCSFIKTRCQTLRQKNTDSQWFSSSVQFGLRNPSTHRNTPKKKWTEAKLIKVVSLHSKQGFVFFQRLHNFLSTYLHHMVSLVSTK